MVRSLLDYFFRITLGRNIDPLLRMSSPQVCSSVDECLRENQASEDAVKVDRKRRISPDVAPPERRKKSRKEDIVDQRYLDGIHYYFENGLRKVEPYYFTWRSHAKGRWIGRTIEDVFKTEFFAVNEEVTKARLYANPSNIFVNGVRVDISQKIRNNDFIANYTHRHEMPVTDQPIKIIAETEEMLVIDKPASIPAHPCGRFRMNSVQYILAKEHGLNNLRLVHRLDRLTSGLMIFSKTLASSRAMRDLLYDRSLVKEYLCQVKGKFSDEKIICNEPIDCVNLRVGIYKVMETGKESITEFDRLCYNEVSDTSIVHCKPKTGRTHQIRVHLQHLGYPIVNDPVYGPDPKVTVRGLMDELNGKEGGDCEVASDIPDLMDDARLVFAKREKLPEGVAWIDPECPECWIDFVDPKPEELRIDLHCWKYEGPGWKFETDMPFWAKEALIQHQVSEQKEMKAQQA